jgi:hypothetical protein
MEGKLLYKLAFFSISMSSMRPVTHYQAAQKSSCLRRGSGRQMQVELCEIPLFSRVRPKP